MKNARVARRYAQALLDLAGASGELDQVLADLQVVRRAVAGVRALDLFLKNPVIRKEKKKEIIAQLFREKIHSTTFSFLLFLLEKGREEMIPDVVDQYTALLDEQNGVVGLDLRSAVRLSADDEEKMRQSFERLTGKSVRLEVRQDPSLIGGVVVRVGDTVYDGSLRRQLEVLRQRLAHGTNGLT
jgi:F-type H+-transporting ATPase subunit delta